jgi:hypothetical protein
MTVNLDRCSICKEPAHASETDDFDRCKKCRRKGAKSARVKNGARVVGSHGDAGRVIAIDFGRRVAMVKWDGHADPTLCPLDLLAVK